MTSIAVIDKAIDQSQLNRSNCNDHKQKINKCTINLKLSQTITKYLSLTTLKK